MSSTFERRRDASRKRSSRVFPGFDMSVSTLRRSRPGECAPLSEERQGHAQRGLGLLVPSVRQYLSRPVHLALFPLSPPLSLKGGGRTNAVEAKAPSPLVGE